MYIRRVTRKNKDGTTVAYLQLAHNEWDPKAKYAKAKVIYSFGHEDEVDRAVLERLAKASRGSFLLSRFGKRRSWQEKLPNFDFNHANALASFDFLTSYGDS